MLTTSARLGWAGGLLALLVAPLPTMSARAADLPRAPSVAEVEALCPQVAGNPVRFGLARGEGDAALDLAAGRGARHGFTENTALYTAWSDQLAAVDYVQDVPGGEPLGDWLAPLEQALRAAGWEPTEDASLLFNAKAFLKVLPTADGSRLFQLEVDLHGERRGVTLRCGDAELLALDQNERNGILAPGSPRPQPFSGSVNVEGFLARFDCTDPALLALFAKASATQDAAALVEARFGPAPDLFAEATYQSRLVTWLKWRMLRSDLMNDEEMWAVIERVAAQDPPAYAEELASFVGAVGNVLEADAAGDSAAHCRAFADAMGVMARQSAADARRDAALAAALIEEAARRGIALD